MNLKQDADRIIRESIASVLPDEAVKTVLTGEHFQSQMSEGRRLFLVAVGKAAWQMADTAATLLGNRLEQGIVLTKYHHGKGKGRRNQELALSAAIGIQQIENAAIFSVGSDGTDGPTDAAGGYADGDTFCRLKEAGMDIYKELENNNAYEALAQCDGLIKTGPTGTNVNNVAVLLIRHK